MIWIPQFFLRSVKLFVQSDVDAVSLTRGGFKLEARVAKYRII